MYPYIKVKIRSYEKGFHFVDKEFRGILNPGTYRLLNLRLKTRVDVMSQREPWIAHEALDLVIQSGALAQDAIVLDLKDTERALVWIDGRFNCALGPGRYAAWTGVREVKAEVVTVTNALFQHDSFNVMQHPSETLRGVIGHYSVAEGQLGLYFADGNYFETLQPGNYAVWTKIASVKIVNVDMREQVVDVAGQEIVTSDKVTLRLNTTVTYKVSDAVRSVTSVADVRQALYREAQLALRAIVGTRPLDTLLTEKDAVGAELQAELAKRVERYGLSVVTLGIRDIILPGEMKELMNKVTEAQKAAEANAIARREETAAMRSQANTAKLLENNPTLMRLRELEVLEKIAANAKLSVMLGDKGLADRVLNVL